MPIFQPMRRTLWIPYALGLALAAPLGAQAPFALPPAEIQRRLAAEPFAVVGIEDNRWDGDRTQRARLRFADGVSLPVKWARSAEGGAGLNNQPRYELAADRLQRLFLDEADLVVPPTVLRAVPLRVYRQIEPGAAPTFPGTRAVLVVLQYWLEGTEQLEAPDLSRLGDEAYVRRLANLNLLTYLVRHADSNPGNVLVARGRDPRMFVVDNGVAFSSPDSPHGTLWKDLLVDRLPAAAVRRLRALTRERLESALSVVAQFRVRDGGRLQAMRPTPKLAPRRAVEQVDDVIRLGLTDREIDGVWDRLQTLLRRVDAGYIGTF